MHNKSEGLILSFETGLDGGTVSILENGEQIDYAKGSGKVSKSEDLLLLLGELLEKNQIRKRAIKSIVVSDAPGSLTGIRIGLAIAKGLSAALNIEIEKSSVLEALLRLSGVGDNLRAAISTQSCGIYHQSYAGQGSSVEINRCRNLEEFITLLQSSVGAAECLIVNEDLYNALALRDAFKELIKQYRIKSIGGNFAEILGKSINK